ncbi:MAG: hypothetical protein ACR2FY_20595 [Pirellulaceae bacterium]
MSFLRSDLMAILTMIRAERSVIMHEGKKGPPSYSERKTAYDTLERLVKEVQRLDEEVESLKKKQKRKA